MGFRVSLGVVGSFKFLAGCWIRSCIHEGEAVYPLQAGGILKQVKATWCFGATVRKAAVVIHEHGR